MNDAQADQRNAQPVRGDIAVGTAVGDLDVRLADFDWRGLYPDLAAFSGRIEQRPSFATSTPVAQTISDRV